MRPGIAAHGDVGQPVEAGGIIAAYRGRNYFVKVHRHVADRRAAGVLHAHYLFGYSLRGYYSGSVVYLDLFSGDVHFGPAARDKALFEYHLVTKDSYVNRIQRGSPRVYGDRHDLFGYINRVRVLHDPYV